MPLHIKRVEGDKELVKRGVHCDEWRYDYEKIGADLTEYKRIGMMKEYWQTMRDMSHSDFFFFCYFALDLPVNHPFIMARIYEIQDKGYDMTLNLWAREHFKALGYNTPVLTTKGWKKHGELEVGDYVFGSDGLPTMIIARTKNFKDSRQYEITFNNKHKIVASCDHIWEVEKKSRKRVSGTSNKRISREKSLMTTDEIFEYGCVEDKRLAIESQAVEYQEKPYYIHPYVLGAWLGDGTSSCSNITGEDKEIFDKIESFNEEVFETSNKITKRIGGLITRLRKYNLINNKHIPENYKTGSFKQRLDLLRGLMDTDGTIDNRNRCCFVNINRTLAYDVYDLACSLGLNPTIGTFLNNQYQNYVFYQVSFAGRKETNPFYLKRKADKVYISNKKQYRFITDIKVLGDGEHLTNCIQVEAKDGIYLAGKELIKTHNSTILTYALPLWVVSMNSERRFCIFSFTRALAKSHLRRIKHTMESKEVLWKAFPDVFFSSPKLAPKWSEDDGLYVKRKGIYKEATFEASGLVDGMPVGKHYTDRCYDDVITERSVATPAQITKATEAFKLSDFLGTRKGSKYVIGTKYSHKDTYSDLARLKVWKKRLFPAEIDLNSDEITGKIGGHPIMFTAEELKSKHEQQGDFIYSAQMLQNPTVASDMKFNLLWLENYVKLPQYMNKYILVDPAGSQKKTSDYTVMIVIGTDSLRNYYLVDMIRDKLNLGERWQKVVELVQKHGIPEVYYEKYGMQADIEYMKERQEATGIYFNIEEFGGIGSKHQRIMALVPLFQQHRIRIPKALPYLTTENIYRDLILDFIEEYEFYPYSGGHDDILDILARIQDTAVHISFPTTKSEEQTDEIRRNPLSFKREQGGSWMSVV